MTVGAVFLNWMKPAGPDSLTAGIELMARGPMATAWQGIDVKLCQPNTSADAQSHILIYSNGQSQGTEYWRTQKPLDGKALIRIALVAADGPEPITPIQRLTAMTLIRQLRNQYGIRGEVSIP